MKPNLTNINHADFPYLYLKIKKDAETSFVANEILQGIMKYTKDNNSVNFEHHQATTRALVHMLDQIYSDEEKMSSTIGSYRFPAAVKILILKYLQVTHQFDDVPELKL